MVKENHKVLVSIINWNNNTATAECLESIGRIPNTMQPDILLTDNNSTAEPLDVPKKTQNKLHKLEIIKNDQNLGFAKAHNLAIDYAIGKKYRYVCLLNNDVKFTDINIFEKLIKGMNSNGSLAATPTILDTDGKIWYAGGNLNRITSTPTHNRVGDLPENLGNNRPTEHATGCFVLIDANKIADNEDVDLRLPEAYFMYWEDAEWSHQARLWDYNLLYVPSAIITHEVSSSLGMSSPSYVYYIIRNNILYIKRNTPWIYKPSSYLQLLVVDAKYEIKSLFSGWKDFKQTQKALLSAWKDGLMYKTGKKKGDK